MKYGKKERDEIREKGKVNIPTVSINYSSKINEYRF